MLLSLCYFRDCGVRKSKININRLYKTACYVLLLYLIIAVLHGLAPGIWSKSISKTETRGPFRILIFTPIITTLYFVFLYFSIPYIIVEKLKSQLFFIKQVRQPTTRRGPPEFSNINNIKLMSCE